MPVIIRRPYCTESHADFFVRNITVCKGDMVASANGSVSAPVRLDAGGSPDADEPLTLAEAKQHIRFDLTITADDAMVHSWIRAAFRKIERDTGVMSMTSRWRMAIDEFPSWRQPLVLPLWPIQSLDVLAYYTPAGVETEITAGSPGTTLILDSASRPARLALQTTDADWPTDLREFQPGFIEVTAGFATEAEYPDDLKQAAKLLIGQSALFREHAVSGPGVAVSSVLMDYDRWIERWVLPGV